MLYRENGEFKTSYESDLQLFSVLQDRVAIALLLFVLFFLVPWLGSDYLLRAVLIPFLILSLAALGLNMLVGYCGQISLGSGAFMAIGAYAAFNFQVRIDGFPFLLSLIGGGLCATLGGVIFGIPSLRIRGLYLAVATLAAQFFTDWFTNRVPFVTHYSSSGSVSVGHLQIFGISLDSPASRYLLCLSALTVFSLLCANLVRSAKGREWMAVRDMDVAASVIGISLVRAKLSAFAVSSFIIGFAGALWGFLHLGSWEPAAFGIDKSLQLLFMVIIGGLGSISGAFLGAAFMVLLPLLLTLAPHWFGVSIASSTSTYLEHIIFGALIVFFLIIEPHGLAKLCHTGREKLRIWPFPH
jgi:branched-chain amino acid transport system permease protein